MKTIILFMSFLVIGNSMSYAALPKPEKQEEQVRMCELCGQNENLLKLSYPKKFTVHTINGESHIFHTHCIFNSVITEKKFNCPLCPENLSVGQVNRLYFAEGFPEDVLEGLGEAKIEKLRRHCTDKVNGITKLMSNHDEQAKKKPTKRGDELFEQLFNHSFLNKKNSLWAQQSEDKFEQSNRQLVYNNQRLNDENVQFKTAVEDLKKRNEQLVLQKRRDSEIIQEQATLMMELKTIKSVELLKKNELEISALKLEKDSYRLQKNLAFSVAGVLALTSGILSYKVFYRK